jgi:protein-L-isoaspartate(D-aspartate) O-methyltransferase
MQNQSIIPDPHDLFIAARTAMVVSQLHPSGIITERVLNAYKTVRRENFVPRDKGSICYSDETIDLSNGTFLLEPLVHGLLTEHLAIQDSDKILIVGDPTGYTKAIMNQLSSSVFECADGAGLADQAPFDVIFIAGAVSEFPAALIDQLATDGRMGGVVAADKTLMGQVVITTKNEAGILAHRVIKDAKVPYIKGGSPQSKFVF